MGCASSKAFEREDGAVPRLSRGISMPTQKHHLADDFHIVALTSSTYGILKLDHPKALEEESDDADPVQQMLRRLSNLESGAEAAPQSWHEVSSMVGNLKPGLDRSISAPAGVGKVVGQISSQQTKKVDAIDIGKVVGEKDDDIVPASSQTKVYPAPTRNPKTFDPSLRIRTLEELDSRRARIVSATSRGLYSKRAGVARPESVQDSTTLSSAAIVSSTSSPTTNSGSAEGICSNVDKTYTKASAMAVETTQSSTTVSTAQGLLKSGSGLFDAGFLGRYEKALTNLSEDDWNAVAGHGDTEVESHDSQEVDEGSEDLCVVPKAGPAEQQAPKSEAKLTEEAHPPAQILSRPVPTEVVPKKMRPSPLEKFEEICPPGGEKAVVLYTTSLRGIRKTYESCNNIRLIVQSFGVPIDERDVSLHLEFRNELRELMGKLVTVPRLFINGRYIGGGEAVSKLHEEENLAELLEGFPKDASTGAICDGCGGARFLPCFDCSGSCKIVGAGNSLIKCPECNENGLIQCPLCS